MFMSTQSVPIKTRHHLAQVISLKGLSGEVKAVEGLQCQAGRDPHPGVGSMACAYLFCIVALVQPAAILIGGRRPESHGGANFLTKPGSS